MRRSHFQGHEIGGGECVFHVRGNWKTLVTLVEEIANELSINPGTLTVQRPPKAPPKKKSKRAKPFDLWAVPLPNGMFGYAQYLCHEVERSADLVRVFSLMTEHIATPEVVLASPEKFPPVFTLISIAANTFGWQWIGNAPVEFAEPIFRQSFLCIQGPGIYDDWIVWSSKGGNRFIGKLPEELRKLEVLTTWSPAAIAERIVSGRVEYDLIW